MKPKRQGGLEFQDIHAFNLDHGTNLALCWWSYQIIHPWKTDSSEG
jgi:hypothetical protein